MTKIRRERRELRKQLTNSVAIARPKKNILVMGYEEDSKRFNNSNTFCLMRFAFVSFRGRNMMSTMCNTKKHQAAYVVKFVLLYCSAWKTILDTWNPISFGIFFRLYWHLQSISFGPENPHYMMPGGASSENEGEGPAKCCLEGSQKRSSILSQNKADGDGLRVGSSHEWNASLESKEYQIRKR